MPRAEEVLENAFAVRDGLHPPLREAALEHVAKLLASNLTTLESCDQGFQTLLQRLPADLAPRAPVAKMRKAGSPRLESPRGPAEQIGGRGVGGVCKREEPGEATVSLPKSPQRSRVAGELTSERSLAAQEIGAVGCQRSPSLSIGCRVSRIAGGRAKREGAEQGSP